jgi:hypothetical protein
VLTGKTLEKLDFHAVRGVEGIKEAAALSGNPCNWVSYNLNVPRTFKSTFLVLS